jgi:hypothetical protein
VTDRPADRPGAPRAWVVDRREGEVVVVLVGDAVCDVPAELVPAAARDGDSLRVTHHEREPGRVVVELAIDEAATARRQAEATALLGRLRAANRGGPLP